MKNLGILGLVLFSPVLAIASEGDIDLAAFISEAVANFGSWNGLEGQALVLAIGAYIVRVLISTLKVSIFRKWVWDKLGEISKLLVPPILGVLLAIVTLPNLGWQTILAGFTAGALGIAVHHLLKVIEGLPGISSTVKILVGLASKLLGGPKQ